MLEHFKVWVKLCVYTQTKQYTPITSAIPQKGLSVITQKIKYHNNLLGKEHLRAICYLRHC